MVRVERTRRSLPAVPYLLLLLSAALSLPSAALAAGTNEWSSIGPFWPGGSVQAIVADGARPGVLYAGTVGGVFKSLDGGASWGAVNSGLGGFTVNGLTLDTLATDTLYAATDAGVFKTTNGGNEWTEQRTGLGAIAVNSVAIDPADHRILYAGTATSGVFKSVDSGATWTVASGGLSSSDVRTVVVAPVSAPRTVWAGTAGGVFISADGGTSWTAAPGFAKPVRSLVVDPVTPSILYLGTDSVTPASGVFKSSNGGQTWTSASTGLGSLGVLSIAVCQTLTSTAFAGTQGSGIFMTRDSGATWSPLPGSPAVAQALALDPNGPNIWSGAPDGFAASPDEGATWQPRPIAFSMVAVNALVSDATSASILYAAVTNPAGTGGGVFKSSNAGATWTFLGGLPDRRVTALAASSGTAPILYAGTNGAGVLRTRDGGTTWSPTGSGLTSPNVNCLVVGGGAVVYAATDSGVFRSADGGDTWAQTDGALSGRIVRTLAIDATGSGLYAGTDTGVYKTTDSGASWVFTSAGLPNVRILALAIDPTAPATIYAGTIAASTGIPSGMGVYRSTDAGLNWAAANTGIETAIVSSLASDPLGAVVYAGTDSGVYRLPRGSLVWTALNHGLADQTVDTILVDRQNSSTLYAGTSRHSVFKAAVGSASGTCVAGPSTLCLNANRFQVEVVWNVRANGTTGNGMAIPLTQDTGAFWFFTSGNVELVLKVVDGRAFNGAFWVFYGAMSDVEYTVTVTDTLTAQTKTYQNPQGQLASVADTSAFPGGSSGISRASLGAAPAPPVAPPSVPQTARTTAGTCAADGQTLCLNSGRFRVEVDWLAPNVGMSGRGQAAPLSSDSGSFWFFSPGNLELNIKVVDGRAVNGRFWVFFGALSDVQYTITVTDTQTGMQRTYSNPQGQLASVADTSAF